MCGGCKTRGIALRQSVSALAQGDLVKAGQNLKTFSQSLGEDARKITAGITNLRKNRR
jgi:hypothetical protein